MCLIDRTQRINWQLVISQIRVSGKGQSFGQIARVTGISIDTLKSLAYQPRQPLHAHGEVIIRYWCDRMGLMRDCLPKVVAASTETLSEGDHSQVA